MEMEMEMIDRRKTSTPFLIEKDFPAATPKLKSATPKLNRPMFRTPIFLGKSGSSRNRDRPIEEGFPADVALAATPKVVSVIKLGPDMANTKGMDEAMLTKRVELAVEMDKRRKEREELEKTRKEREERYKERLALAEDMDKLLPLEQRRNWSEIPSDALAIVFQKLPLSFVRHLAGPVCRSWWWLATHPAGPYLRIIDGRCIDMRRLPFMSWFSIDTDKLCKTAFDYTDGHIDKLYAVNVSDRLLNHIADRATNIKLLSMIKCSKVSPSCLQDFLRCCPLLEELRLYGCHFDFRNYRHISKVCQDLKRFWYEGAYRSDTELNEEAAYRRFKKSIKYHSYSGFSRTDPPDDCDSDGIFDSDSDANDRLSGGDWLATEFSNNMQQLHHLQFIRCKSLTRKGVHAILDKCLHLESLDLRCCFRLRVDEALHNRLSKIKSVRLSRCSQFRKISPDWTNISNYETHPQLNLPRGTSDGGC